MRRMSYIFVALALFASPTMAQIGLENLQPGDAPPKELIEQLLKQARRENPVAGGPQALAGESRQASGIALPQDLFKTEEDAKAWQELVDVIRAYVKMYHRQPSGKEMANWLQHGLEQADPHTQILNPEDGKELREHVNGEFPGVGMEIELSLGNDKVPKGIKVNPIPDQAADKAGVKAQDVVVEICNWDEEKNADKVVIFDTAGKALVPPRCHQTAEISLREAVKLIKGHTNTVVRLVIWRAGNTEPVTLDVTRAVIKVTPVSDLKVQSGFGFLKLKVFNEHTTNDVLEGIKRLKHLNQDKPLSGLVIDVRNNPGGLLDQAINVVSNLVSDSQYMNREASIVLSEEKRGKITALANVQGAKDALNGAPLVILVNGGSASASEIISGVLQIHGRATIAGVEHSFGKGSIQQISELPSGLVLRLTTAQYLIGSRGCEKPIQGVGVQPDILLKPKAGETLAAGGEKDLDHALPTSTVSNANCKYHYSVSPEHKVKALEMLKTFGFNLKDPS